MHNTTFQNSINSCKQKDVKSCVCAHQSLVYYELNVITLTRKTICSEMLNEMDVGIVYRLYVRVSISLSLKRKGNCLNFLFEVVIVRGCVFEYFVLDQNKNDF